MNKIELDENMLEQDKINRFLNMIATQYGGNLAAEYGTYYINKCKRISELEKEIERLKNDKKKILELIENDYFEDGSFENYYKVLNILTGGDEE
jgi:hypothetical protein